jgi:valyl-tRNA synthetase
VSDPAISLPSYDAQALEEECRARWEASDIYRYDPAAAGEPFAVDTPPPYVSASHLHVGHAMSYTQAEFVVRYQRMRGRSVFYPMGFDDNGLPTERHVETVLGLDKRKTTRADFRAACLQETAKGAASYETLFRSLGLSVDWSLRYSTIDEHCRRTAQWSFLDLHRRGHLYRGSEPVTWDPVQETALAQADLELVPRTTSLHTLRFQSPEGTWLPIATTRPELLPACVALYHHPDDPRWQGIQSAIVPLFQHQVPVLQDPDVDPQYGTGLLMVCTFGDAEDVRRWRRDGLPLREVMRRDGRLGDLAGPFAGLKPQAARKAILEALAAEGRYDGAQAVEQTVPTAERSGAEVEWLAVPQWFVRLLPHRAQLKQRATELRFYPPFMEQRLHDWIDGLDRDWNISRQRHYGVPMPVWLCTGCGEPVLAREEDLPVDPLEDPPPVERCPSCGGELRGDPDVMDTWMTSSLTPLVTSNAAGSPGRKAGPFPGTVRVQAFEIIRTWLFYTVAKSELHRGCLPFRDVMISGWGLDEHGKKLSKRTIRPQHDPSHLITKYGADALRHWAGRSALGRDLRFSEQDVRSGRKVAVKLWNAGKLVASFPRGGQGRQQPEDQALLHALDELLETVASGLDQYDYATGLHALDRFLFGTFCDDWLEASKERIRRPERQPEGSPEAAAWVAREVLRALLGAYAPFVPFVTDALWWHLYAPEEGGPSLHLTPFPRPRGAPPGDPLLAHVDTVRDTVRRLRTEQGLPQSREVRYLRVTAEPSLARGLQSLLPTLAAACRAVEVQIEEGAFAVDADFAS